MRTMNPGTEPRIKQMIYFSLFFSLDAVSNNLCSPLSIFLLLLLGGKRICRLISHHESSPKSLNTEKWAITHG